jgi:hypothetical protein
MTEYVEDAGLNDALKEVLTNKELRGLADLRENKVRILPLLMVKTNKEGEHVPGTGQPAICKKVSPLHQSAGIDADYLLVFDYYVFNHPKGIDPKKTIGALIHKALMAIEVVKTDDGLKFKKREPDIVEFSETTQDFGLYTESLQDYMELLNTAARSATDLASGDLEEDPGDTEGSG